MMEKDGSMVGVEKLVTKTITRMEITLYSKAFQPSSAVTRRKK